MATFEKQTAIFIYSYSLTSFIIVILDSILGCFAYHGCFCISNMATICCFRGVSTSKPPKQPRVREQEKSSHDQTKQPLLDILHSKSSFYHIAMLTQSILSCGLCLVSCLIMVCHVMGSTNQAYREETYGSYETQRSLACAICYIPLVPIRRIQISAIAKFHLNTCSLGERLYEASQLKISQNTTFTFILVHFASQLSSKTFVLSCHNPAGYLVLRSSKLST